MKTYRLRNDEGSRIYGSIVSNNPETARETGNNAIIEITT